MLLSAGPHIQRLQILQRKYLSRKDLRREKKIKLDIKKTCQTKVKFKKKHKENSEYLKYTGTILSLIKSIERNMQKYNS